jgi:hypothetical protein
VEDNPVGFVFPTASLGDVPLEPHSFFMYMGGSQVEQVEYGQVEGRPSITLTGGLNCSTEAITASGKFGGREAVEPAGFRAVAIDGADFYITTFFEPDSAPLNNAIFGPEFTFRGRMVDGMAVVSTAATF